MNENRRAFVVKFLARLTICGAIIGCFLQLWLITNDYLKREVVTEIKIESPRKMILPDISFCGRLPFLLDFNRMNATYPEFVNVIQNEFPFVNSSTAYGNFMKIREGYKMVYKELTLRHNLYQISQMMFTPEDVFNAVNIISNKGFGYMTHEEMAERCEWTTYAREQDACFRLTCAKKGPYIYKESDLTRGLFQDEVVEFEIHQNTFALIPNFKIMLHSPGSYPRGQLVASIVVKSYEYATLYYIGYKRFKTNLLPPPFTTNCFIYKSQGFDSRLHKIEECQNKLSLERLNCPFNGNIHSMQMNASHAYVQYFLQYKNESFEKIVNDIHEKCDHVANQPDCKEEFFIPNSKLPRDWKGQFSRIMLNPPTEPDIIHISKEKLPFTEYLVFIESTFGSWFGFCVVGTLPQLYKMAFTSKPKVASVKSIIKRQATKKLKITKF